MIEYVTGCLVVVEYADHAFLVRPVYSPEEEERVFDAGNVYYLASGQAAELVCEL